MEKAARASLVEGRDLKSPEFETTPLRITITGKDGIPEEHALRVLLPKSGDALEQVWERLFNMYQRTTGSEREFYRWVILMLQFYHLSPELDPKRIRHFNIKTLNRSAEFYSMAKMTHMKGTPQIERLIKFAGETVAPTTELLQKAIYKQPEIRVPLSRPHYLMFREQMLSELLNVNEQLRPMEREAIAQARRDIRSDKRIPVNHRTKALAHLAAIAHDKRDTTLSEAYQRIWAELMKEATEIEARHAAQFADLVEEAVRLQAPIADEVDTQHLTRVEADGITLTPEYVACIKVRLDSEAVDRLLWRAIERYEQVFEIAPLRGIELLDVPKEILENQSADEVVPDDQPTLPEGPEFEQYLGFWSAYKTDDVLEKWRILCWITTSLINRNECVRLLRREAEGVYHGVLEYTSKEFYRKISHQLTRPERRAYALLYFRLPRLGSHIAILNPIMHSFFTGMDQDTQALILLVLVFKIRVWKGERLDQELERRWRAYLRLYPFWLEIIQDEDREAKRQRTLYTTPQRNTGEPGHDDEDTERHQKKCRTLSLQGVVATDHEGQEQRLEHVVPDPKSTPDNMLQALIQQEQGELEDWARKYCAPKQATHVIKYFRDQNTEVQIAQEDGITQQAVNKSLHAGIKRIAAGLRRDGLSETV